MKTHFKNRFFFPPPLIDRFCCRISRTLHSLSGPAAVFSSIQYVGFFGTKIFRPQTTQTQQSSLLKQPETGLPEFFIREKNNNCTPYNSYMIAVKLFILFTFQLHNLVNELSNALKTGNMDASRCRRRFPSEIILFTHFGYLIEKWQLTN